MSTIDDRLAAAWSRSCGAWSPTKTRPMTAGLEPRASDAPAPVSRLERLASVSRLVLELTAADRAAVLALLGGTAPAIISAPSNEAAKIIVLAPAPALPLSRAKPTSPGLPIVRAQAAPIAPTAELDAPARNKRNARVARNAPAGLADYPLAAPGKIWRSKQAAPRITVTFADGVTVGAPVPSKPGKPANLGRALRVACAFYRARQDKRPLAQERLTVPAIAAVSGAVVDVDQANAHTAAARKAPGRYVLPPLAPTTVDVAAIVRNTALVAWSMARTPEGLRDTRNPFPPAGDGPWSGGRGMWRLAELAAGVAHAGPYAGRLCDEVLY